MKSFEEKILCWLCNNYNYIYWNRVEMIGFGFGRIYSGGVSIFVFYLGDVIKYG